MLTDWLLRIGDASNFINSSQYKIWGINSASPNSKYFLKNVKTGDRLWFIKNNSKGKIIAVATYISHNERILGPLVNLTMTNTELGWTDDEWTSENEIHYSDLYGLNNCELLTHIKGVASIRKYDEEKCMINLPIEYNYIVKYSKITLEL